MALSPLTAARRCSSSDNFLNVSPGWLDTMRIPLVDGRDFRAGESNVAIVSETFARQYFAGENPTGRTFDKVEKGDVHNRYQIIGLVRDVRYRSLRESILPAVDVPFDARRSGMIPAPPREIIRWRLASLLRQAVRRARSEFRVSNIRTAAGDQFIEYRSRAVIGDAGGVLLAGSAVACGRGTVWRARLFRDEGALRNRHTDGRWRSGNRHRPAGHVGCFAMGAGWRGGRPGAGDGLSAIHRVVVV